MLAVEIKDSPVHGKGVFAKEKANPGELIGIYEGTIIHEDWDEDDPHVLWLRDDEGRFFGIKGTGTCRFMNHDGDDPNAVLGANSVYIFCARPIKVGEEIFISYGDDIDFDEEEEEA